MNHDELTEWLFLNICPILRFRVAVDLINEVSPIERKQLLRDTLAATEMQRWLDIFSRSRTIHRSKDTDAENPIAKLLDYGLNCDVHAFDERVQRLLNSRWKVWEDLVY